MLCNSAYKMAVALQKVGQDEKRKEKKKTSRHLDSWENHQHRETICLEGLHGLCLWPNRRVSNQFKVVLGVMKVNNEWFRKTVYQNWRMWLHLKKESYT